MKFRRVLWGVGSVLKFFSLILLVPILPALVWDGRVAHRSFRIAGNGVDLPETAIIFILTSLVTAFLGLFLEWLGEEEENIRDREGYAIVAIGWILITLLGALPFVLSGVMTSYVDAFFETMSGLTTTGATVMEFPLEQYPESIMFYRSFLQWLGGLGIIVLSVALLAKLTHGGVRLMRAEFSGTAGGRLRPKIAQTAKVLWAVYLFFSVVFFVMIFGILWSRGLPVGQALYEGILHTFSGISSGGFSNRTDSLAAFGAPVLEFVMVFVMVMAGVNFTLHYDALTTRRVKAYFVNPEFRFYVGLSVLVALVLTGILWRAGEALDDAFRLGLFQGVSILTTTGYTTAAFNGWPDSARLILLLLMFTGASVGSTSGALKAVRILILIKLLRREVRRLLHPRAVVPIRLGDAVLNDDAIKTISVFFFSYVTIFIFSTIGMTLMNMDLISGASAVAATLGNVGPGLGSVHLGYWNVPVVGKIWLAILMLVGRLEIFTFLILLFPATWRR